MEGNAEADWIDWAVLADQKTHAATRELHLERFYRQYAQSASAAGHLPRDYSADPAPPAADLSHARPASVSSSAVCRVKVKGRSVGREDDVAHVRSLL